jgi:hypothetical protein
MASQRFKNGSQTVALICPQVDTIRLAAAPMVGEVETRCLAFLMSDVGCSIGIGAGKSREGKSSELCCLRRGRCMWNYRSHML